MVRIRNRLVWKGAGLKKILKTVTHCALKIINQTMDFQIIAPYLKVHDHTFRYVGIGLGVNIVALSK